MQSRWRKIKIFKAIFTLILLLSFRADLFAGMAVSPLKQWVEVKPGEDASFSVTVTNGSKDLQTTPCVVYAQPMDFSVSDDGQLAFGPEQKSPRSAAGWITLDASEFVLQPGESKELKAKISAPAAADGDYWAAIMLTLGGNKNTKTNVNVVLRTASGVFVHVARRNYIEQPVIADVNAVLPKFSPKNSPSKEKSQKPASEDLQTAPVLKIDALLKNDGLVAIEPEGKVFLYTEKSRRIGYIPLYANRKQVLPGHSRWFSGVMSQQLAAGNYKARIFFTSGSKYSRTKTKDISFTISPDLAAAWSKNSNDDNGQMIELNPGKLDLELNPGRFTVAKLLVTNTSSATISANCTLEDNKTEKGWIKIDSPQFSLAPGAKRSIACSIRIPPGTAAENYNASIHVKAERSGLSEQAKNNIVLEKIPVHISVTSHSGFASEDAQ